MEHYIRYDTGRLARECGFDEPSKDYYWGDELIHADSPFINSELPEDMCNAYPQSWVQKWLREIKGKHLIVIPTITCAWTFKIMNVWTDDAIKKSMQGRLEVPPYNEVHAYDYNTYEEALEEGLKQALIKVKEGI